MTRVEILLAMTIFIVNEVNPSVSHPVESTFRNIVCQQCNSWCLPPQHGVGSGIGKAGPRGPVGPAGPAGIVNMTAVEAMVDGKIDEAIGFLKIKSCDDVSGEAAKSTNDTDGVFDIANPVKFGRLQVYCDLNTDGGQWTIFQRRIDGSVDFYRDWNDYVNGFGNINGEFWLGLAFLHEMTKYGDQELRIDMIDRNGIQYYVKYSIFLIGSALENYKLMIGGYSGNTSDSLAYHDDAPFTTKDRDNDENRGNCAVGHRGGWWFKSCAHSGLNGDYDMAENWQGVVWYNRESRQRIYMRYTEMKIRRKK